MNRPRRRFRGEPSRAPRRLKVIAANQSIEIEHLALLPHAAERAAFEEGKGVRIEEGALARRDEEPARRPPNELEFAKMKSVSAEEAVAMIPNGATVMVGGFMGVGTPERLVNELVRQNKSELTVICNDAGLPGKGVGKLFDATLVSTLTASHIGLNPKAQQQMMAKQIAVDLVPQGTLVERIRAGGCGLGGVLTPTGVGTIVEEGKQHMQFNGKTFLLETAMRADFALIHASVADHLGNLTYMLTARNFNPVMAMAADTVIVTAEHIVPVGVIAPDQVVTPAPLVDYLVMKR